jgi:hypothetical protein
VDIKLTTPVGSLTGESSAAVHSHLTAMVLSAFVLLDVCMAIG